MPEHTRIQVEQPNLRDIAVVVSKAMCEKVPDNVLHITIGSGYSKTRMMFKLINNPLSYVESGPNTLTLMTVTHHITFFCEK